MRLKRAFDLAFAGAALIVTGPLFIAATIAVKLDSRGPAFFIQERVGRGKRPIRVAKFRTMVPGADRIGPAITVSRDPRITPVGVFLRKTKLDELPQLWNVLRGDMSIVGPRPEVPRYVASYPALWDRVFDVRPGLTDLASIVFRDEEQLLATARDRERAYKEVVLPMKIELALRGIERTSLPHDVAVIARTVLAIAFKDTYRTDVLDEARRRITHLNGEV